MSGVSSPVYGSGGGSGGAKLPSTLFHLSGTIRDEAVDWEAGATCVAVVKMSAANPVSDTQISGGLYATATGLSFTDGTNTAQYSCTWSAGDTISVVLKTSLLGKMQLGLLKEVSVSLWQDYLFWADSAQWSN